MHLTETPRPLRELVADVPAHVEAAVTRALGRARDDRFDSITSFLGALQGGVPGTLVLGPSEPTKVLPAAKNNPELPVERTVVRPAATTFSRATGEVGAADEDLLFATARPRRWL